MSTQRLSLSSPVFAGRVKKYDSYFHDSRTSQRTPNMVVRPHQREFNKIEQAKPVESVAKPKINQLRQPNLIKQENFGTNQKLIFGLQKPPASIKNSKAPSVAISAVKVNNPTNIALSTLTSMQKHQKLQELNSVNAIESQFKEEKPKISLKSKILKAQTAFYAIGVAVFIFASFVSVQTFMNNRQAKEQLGVLGEQTWTSDEQGVQEGTSEDPSDAPVSAEAVANYKVDPELPRYIKIPEIGVYARIKQTGITKDGAVAAPSNINDVSWFNESARPGNPIGSSLLLGHVSGWSAPGVFKKIDKLTAGARIEIDKGSGEKLMYEVVKTEKVPVDQIDMSKILASEVVGEHDLKLITCGGKYDRESKEYTDRVVVYAKYLK